MNQQSVKPHQTKSMILAIVASFLSTNLVIILIRNESMLRIDKDPAKFLARRAGIGAQYRFGKS
jgi:hypothetical protein